MKPYQNYLATLLIVFGFVLKLPAQTVNKKVTAFVNPFIGSAAVDKKSLPGCAFPGATMPFGFVQLSPDTKHEVNRPCSGYDYNDNTIVGFSHTHLNGTGIADLLDVLIMRTTGNSKTGDDYTHVVPRHFRSPY